MKISRKWLNEFVDIDVSDKEYGHEMTMSGSMVEATQDLGKDIENIVVGRVLEIKKHEDSDHLFICTVDAGQSETLTIVTGAQNVQASDLVPVAIDGSMLPGGVEIHAGMLRGVMSQGMLCSLKELNLTVNDFPYAIEDGIFILQEDCAVGQDIRSVIGYDDSAVEFEITSNRPDCLSMIGLARETAATFHKELKLHTPVVKGSGGSISDYLDIEVEDPDLCPRYTARLVKNVRIGPSPKWMRQRLRNCGVRPINNIVDITNYVMLEYGQPMHSFDFSCIDGEKIIVRRAKEGEAITTLDGTERKLGGDMLVIADEKKPVGVAGVMGGENSEITENTVDVVFESANFSGSSIHKTALGLNMRTDASGRYEKGLDPMNTLPAVQRACELVELLGAGDVIDGVIDILSHIPEPANLQLESRKINKLLGTDIPESDMQDMLRALGFSVSGDTVVVPSWRADVTHMADLAEEVARLYGYNKMPTTMFRGKTAQGGYSASQRAENLASSVCRSMGYSEILTYSFVSPSGLDKIKTPADSPLRQTVRIINPLGEDTSVMRTTTLPTALEVLARNKAARNPVAKLYELGKVYLPQAGSELPSEPKVLTLCSYGGGGTFFTLKGEVEALLAQLNIREVSYVSKTDAPAYHPGRCAAIIAGGFRVGVFGQIHPLVAGAYDLDSEVFAAEIQFTTLIGCIATEKEYVPLPRYPAVTRDIALVCRDEITVADLQGCILENGGNLLSGCEFFDMYKGAPIPQGQKSLAFSLVFRAEDRTLTDSEVDAVVSSILDALNKDWGAVLR